MGHEYKENYTQNGHVYAVYEYKCSNSQDIQKPDLWRDDVLRQNCQRQPLKWLV